MNTTLSWNRLWVVVPAVWLTIVVFFSAQSIPQLQDLDLGDALQFTSDEALNLLDERRDEIESIRYGPEWVSIYYVEDHNFSIDENDLLSSDLLDAGAPALRRARMYYWYWSLAKYWIAPLLILFVFGIAKRKWPHS